MSILNTAGMTRCPLGGRTRFVTEVNELPGRCMPSHPIILESDRTGARVAMEWFHTEYDAEGDVLWVDYKGESFGVELRVFND